MATLIYGIIYKNESLIYKSISVIKWIVICKINTFRKNSSINSIKSSTWSNKNTSSECFLMIKTPIKSLIKNWLKKSTILNLSTSSTKLHFCLPIKISFAINKKFLSKVFFVLCRFTDFGASGINQIIPGRTPKSSYHQAKQSEIQSDWNRTNEIW